MKPDLVPSALPLVGPELRRVAIGNLPTNVEPLEALSSRLGVEVWAKREDQSGPIYGGNKVRKLEFLLGEALSRGSGRVLTVGTWGSHHVLATALYSRVLGLQCHALLYPQYMTPHAEKTFSATLRSGARLTRVDHVWLAPIKAAAAAFGSIDWSGRRLPYYIGPGGSTPVGMMGDVSAAFELADQVRAGLMPEPRWIIVPLGSGGTASGLSMGLVWAGLKTRVLAVRAVHGLFANRRACRGLMKALARKLMRHGAAPPSVDVAMERLSVVGDWYKPGYARPNPEGEVARAQLSDQLRLDPGYTAKAAAALLARAADLGGPILFWNTVNSVDLTPLLGERLAVRGP